MIGSEGESAPRRFVVDTNVSVAAIKPFSGRSRTASTDTGSLALLMRLVTDSELELFGSLWLLDEYKRLAEELNSETSELILGRQTGKMREVAEIGDEAVARCRPYLPEKGGRRHFARRDMPSSEGSPDNQRRGFRQDQGIRDNRGLEHP